MAAGRDIHGRVVMDVTADTDGLREDVDRKLARAFDLNVDINLPTRAAMQEALDRKVGRGLKLFIDELNMPGKAEMQAQLDTKTGKGLKLKIAGFDLPNKSVLQAQLDAKLGTGLKIKANIDVNDASFLPVVTKAKAAQQAITSIEAKEELKRQTARENSIVRAVAAQIAGQAKLGRDRELLEDRTNARLEILTEQHFNRINAQTAASALRREVIESNLNARLAVANDAFEKRRIIAAEAADRALRNRASKPILQSIIIDANKLNSSLADFDKAVTRALRVSLLSFTVWSAGVTAITGAAAGAALVSFAKLEAATARASAVFAGGAYADALEKGTATTRTFGDVVTSVSDQVQQASKKIALQTLFNPTEVAQGFQSAAQAGLSFKDSVASLLPVTQFAQNELLDVNEALELLTGGLAASGKKGGDELKLLADKFTLVGNASNATAKEVAEAFSNQAAAAFRSYGQSADQALAVINLFGKANQRGLQAGTQTAILIREINNAAFNKSPEAFKKYGIALQDANGKAVPFTKTLGQLGALFKKTRDTQGNAGVAKLRKELGLTEKSLRGLIILLPQIEKLGTSGLERQVSLIEKAQGSVARQAGPIQDTIQFQFQQTLENVQNLFSTFGKGARNQLIAVFDAFNGPNGRLSQLNDDVKRLGERFGDLIGQFAEFLLSPQAARGAAILVDSVRITLLGVRDAFSAFSEAFSKSGESQSAFVGFAKSVRAFSQVSAAVLPKVAKAVGEIFSFLIDHADAFETFAKLTLGVYAARKAFTLLVSPALVSADAILRARGALVAWSAAETIGPVKSAAVMIATQFGIIGTEADVAAAAIGRLTLAEKTQATASIGQGISSAATAAGATRFVPLSRIPFKQSRVDQQVIRAGREGVAELGSAGAGAARTGAAAKSTKDFAAALNELNPALEKSGGLLSKLGPALGKAGIVAAIVTTAIDLARGAVHGFTDEFDRLAKGKNFEEFKVGLEGVKSVLHALGDALGFVSRAIQAEGAKFGKLLADEIFVLVSSIGYAINFVKAVPGAVTDAFRAVERAIGGALASIERNLASMLAKLGSLPGGGKFREWADELNGAADAAENWGKHVKDASDKTVEALTVVPKYLKDTRDGTWKLNQEWVRNQKIMKIAASGVETQAKNIATAVLNHIPGATAALRNFNEALRTAAANRAADAAFTATYDKLTGNGTVAITPESQVDVLTRAGNAAALARARMLQLYPAATKAAKAVADVTKKPAATGAGTGGAAGDTPASTALTRVKTAAEQASAAVDALTGKQFQAAAVAAIGKATNSAAGGYKATRVEAEVLRRVLPGLEKDLQTQKDAVQKLDTALNNLRNTQLKGTKAFSDQLFANDQQSKALQLQRVNLVIGGASDTDPAIKAIDDQLTVLRNQAEKVNLEESLQLDPLRKKIEDTFQPVKELGFDQIMAQFQAINKQRAPLVDAITGGDQLKAVLDKTIGDAELRFSGAGKQVSAGLARGIRAGAKEVSGAGKTVGDSAIAGLNSVMDFGSPSKTMHRQGVWVAQGVAQGIAAATPQVVGAATLSGSQTMGGFLAGLKQGFGTPEVVGSVAWYLNVFIPDWIRKNKGPVAYDATILVPAGHAVMEGFGKGLRQGFSEVAGFVKDVGPSLGEYVSTDLFSQRTATIMADIALGKTPDVEAALGDLRPAAFTVPGFSGPVDPSLSFLHPTMSLADTARMAAGLSKLFGVSITALRDDHSYLTSSGNVSDHALGLAADLSNGVNTSQEASLFAALTPLVGTVIKQLIFRHSLLDARRGAEYYGANDHFNHDHVSFLPAKGFSADSGKFGFNGFNIPGVSGIVEDAINRASQATGVSAFLLAALAKAESGFNPNAKSGVGALGLTQLMPATAKSLGVTNPLDPFQNALGGAKYLKQQLAHFGGNVSLALAAYNAGPGNAKHALGSFPETIAYVQRIMEFLKSFGGARELGGPTMAGKAYLVGERGPELHVPSRNGHVIPADQTSRILSGGTTPQYIDNSVTNVTTAATDPDIVAEKIDRKKKDRFTGVNFR